MLKRFHKEALRRIKGKPQAHVVLLWLEVSTRSQNQVLISRAQLGKDAGLSQPTLRKALQVLEEARLIRMNRANNIIELNPRMYWQGYDEMERQREMETWAPEFVRRKGEKPDLRVLP